MYDSIKIANRIKELAKQQNKPISEVLTACGLGINTISKMRKGTDIRTLNFAKIADYLNTSCDYLLGRTDDPTFIPKFEQKDVRRPFVYSLEEIYYEPLFVAEPDITEISDDLPPYLPNKTRTPKDEESSEK